MKKSILSLVTFLIMLPASPTVCCADQFQPYRIKPGISYYSDEYTITNGLPELGEEKNYEEIYQNYNYYEVVFDSQERMVIFKAYKKGVIEFSETYYYDPDGRLDKKVVKNPDGTELVVNF